MMAVAYVALSCRALIRAALSCSLWVSTPLGLTCLSSSVPFRRSHIRRRKPGNLFQDIHASEFFCVFAAGQIGFRSETQMGRYLCLPGQELQP